MNIFRGCVAIASVCALSLSWGCNDEDDPKGTEGNPAQAEAGASGSDAATPAPADAGGIGGGAVGGGTLTPDQMLPIVFIHGFVGSAQQYESQAQRFAMNGYPLERIRAYEHDGTNTDIPAFARGADAFIDGVMKEFGVSKIYLVGHSRGTSVSTEYLTDPVRAAKVAKYIALDGRPCPMGPVPCDAPNQANLPGQKHVEVSTSQASFERQFEFLFGKKPTASAIVAQGPTAKISGRIVNFPQNTGRVGTLELWEIATETGARVGAQPLKKFDIGESSDWGPVDVKTDKHYEFVMSAPAVTGQHHFYMQRFLRDSRFVRLLSGGPDTPTRMNTNTSENHVALSVSRQREWTVDDKLEISTTSPAGNQPVVNIISPTMEPPFRMSIGIHLHDDAATPKMTTLAGIPYFNGVPGTGNMGQPFQAGYDVYMPAANPTNGHVTVRAVPRGHADKPQVINLPNWPSAMHSNSVVFSDYPQ